MVSLGNDLHKNGGVFPYGKCWRLSVVGFLFFVHWGCTPIRRSASADVQVTGRMAKFQKGTGGIR